MITYFVGCALSYRVPQATSFVFNLEAAHAPYQNILRERLTVTPPTEAERWTMPESGNRYCRFLVQPGELRLDYEAEIRLDPILEEPDGVGELTPDRLPLSVFTHLYPSRYCQSDRLERFARRTFGQMRPGYERVNGICSWIYENVDYESGSSDELTSAVDILTDRAGVCRDFTHLAIALCRVLCIPARYVSAYAYRLSPSDFHAVFEAYLEGPSGGGWYLFDATRKAAPDGLVRIGVGRDAAEVAFCSPYGSMEAEKPKVWVSRSNDARNELTTKAIRTS